jgi:hypothetical protein
MGKLNDFPPLTKGGDKREEIIYVCSIPLTAPSIPAVCNNKICKQRKTVPLLFKEGLGVV